MAGTISPDTLIRLNAWFFTRGDGNVIAGYVSVSSITTADQYLLYQSKGDPMFTASAIFNIESSESQTDYDILASANLQNQLTPGGGPSWYDLHFNAATWINPQTQQPFQGDYGVAAAFQYAISSMNDLQIMQAVQNAWGSSLMAKEQANAKTWLKSLIIPPYVPATPTSEASAFPQDGHAITNGMAIILADQYQTRAVADPQDPNSFILQLIQPYS